MSPLKNAVNDARAMDKALRSSGFQTVTLENARKADMDRAIGEFLDKLGPDDTALLFFAGHAPTWTSRTSLQRCESFRPSTTLKPIARGPTGWPSCCAEA